MLGMMKFFLYGKGLELLKVIEDNDNCVILMKWRSENKLLGIEVKVKEVMIFLKFICSNFM